MLKTLLPLAFAISVSATEQISTPIENNQVKVLSVVVQPHEKTRLHEHKVNRVMIYLQPGRQTFDYQDGRHSVLDWKAGEVKWSPAAGMHVAEITSGNPVNIVEVELKQPGTGKAPSSSLDPLKVDPKHYHVELENDQVRVLRVRIGAKETAPMHEHMLNRVIVYLTDQNFRVTNADGKVETPQHKAGEVSWGSHAKHTETNLSDKPFDVVVVELKD